MRKVFEAIKENPILLFIVSLNSIIFIGNISQDIIIKDWANLPTFGFAVVWFVMFAIYYSRYISVIRVVQHWQDTIPNFEQDVLNNNLFRRMKLKQMLRDKILFEKFGVINLTEETAPMLKEALTNQLFIEDGSRFHDMIEVNAYKVKDVSYMMPDNLYTFIIMCGLELPPHPAILSGKTVWVGTQAIYNSDKSRIEGRETDFLIAPLNIKT